MIRIQSFGAPYEVKTSLKKKVVKLLNEKGPRDIPWSFISHISKHHKIAIYRPVLKTEDDCKHVAEILQSLNPVIKAIACAVQDKID